MGIYLNTGNVSFQEALYSEIYVDKSELIKHINKVLKTKQKYIYAPQVQRFDFFRFQNQRKTGTLWHKSALQGT